MKPRVALPLWLLAVAICAAVIWRSPPISRDLTYFLPRDPGVADRILIEQLRSGFPSRLMLVALGQADPQALAAASEQLAGKLRSDASFERVDNGHALWSEAEVRLITEYRYLLSPAIGPGHFARDALRRSLETRLVELTSTAGWVTKQRLPRDPTGETMRVLSRFEGRAQPPRHLGVWFSHDGARALLIAQTRAPGFDLDAQGTAVAAVRSAFAEVAHPASMTLQLSGPGPFSVEINRAITRDAERISTVTLLAVGLFLGWVYGSLRFIVLTLLPLACGALAGMAAVTLFAGSVHGIMLGFGSALIGFANDYPIHLFTHLNDREPGEAAIRRIWPTIRLGVATTVAGFGAMLFSGFPGLVELGLFSIVGLLAAGLVCRWVMPHFVTGAFALPRWNSLFRGLDRGPRRCTWYGAAVAATLALMANAISSAPLWDDDIAHLTPLPESRQRFDQQLRSELRAPELNRVILVLGDTQEAVLERSEALAGKLDALVQESVLAGYDLAARILPSERQQRSRQRALPDPRQLRLDLNEAVRGLPFAASAFEPFLEDVARAREQAPLSRADLAGTALALGIEPLLFPYADQWVALITLGDVSAPERLAASVTGEGIHFLDLRHESTRLITRYRQETLGLLALGAILIVLLLRLGLGTWAAAGRVLLPMVLALLVTGTTMRVVSGGLSLFHLISLLLVMGLAMDYGLFFNRSALDLQEHRRTQVSLLVCTATTILAFGLLALSQTPLLQAIGTTVSLGSAAAFVFAASLARPGGVSA